MGASSLIGTPRDAPWRGAAVGLAWPDGDDAAGRDRRPASCGGRACPGRLLLQTLRSHDQFTTTIYGPDDRYRGISGGRRVVMVNPADLAELGVADGDVVDLVSEFADDADRRAEGFRVVAYDTARGCAAAYVPATNVLVPLDSTADRSTTPTSKPVVIRLDAVHG